MNIITEGKVLLSNGFQRGQWVIFLEEKDGLWSSETISTGECTWVDDAKVSALEVVLEGKKGIVGGYYGVSSLSYQKYVTGFFGFSEEELQRKSTEKGFVSKDKGLRAYDWEDVTNLAGYLEAKFVWKSFTPWSSFKDGIHEMPYQWGDQPAASYPLIIGGKLVDAVTGCGDCTPYLTESREKCLADRKLHTSNKMSDDSEERFQYEQDFWATAERVGVAEEYRRLATNWSEANNGRLNELSHQIEVAMLNSETDKRAEKDPVLRRLVKHYRSGQNPLRSLRSEKGGRWTFHRDDKKLNLGDFPEGTQVFHGDNWWVTWEKL